MGAFSQRGQPRERYVEINSPTPTLIDLPDIFASCSLLLVSQFFSLFPPFSVVRFFPLFRHHVPCVYVGVYATRRINGAHHLRTIYQIFLFLTVTDAFLRLSHWPKC